MKNPIRLLAYVVLLGPPHALQIHADAQNKGGELDGLPVWMVFGAEFLMRASVFLMISWGLQEVLGNETFRRFQVFFLIGAVFASGFVHTTVYFYCFFIKWEIWPKSRLGRVYRMGRNLAYSVIPAFFTSGLMLGWQEYNQMPLFQGHLVETTFFIVWGGMAVLGVIEAILVKRKPLGIVVAQSIQSSSKKSAP